MLEVNRKFRDFYRKRARYKFARGGRAGSKSHNAIIIAALLGKEKPLLIVCLREFQKNLEESVYRLLCNKIRMDDSLTRHYRIMSDKIIGLNGTEIVFSGIKNAKNFKSFEGADIAIVEEAQTISAESMMIMIPTIRKPGSEIWFLYNPDEELDPVHQAMLNPFSLETEHLKMSGFSEEEIINIQASYDVGQVNIEINYYDNPHCPAIMKAEARKMERLDPELYRHVWLGECRKVSDAVIYKGRYQELEFTLEDYFGIPMFDGQVMDMIYGLDFGWVHPQAIIESFRYKGAIYIWNEIVGTEMDMDDTTTRIINEMPWATNKPIYADSARADLIDTLCLPRLSKQGVQLPSLNVLPAKKGAGSVEAGITWLKTHTMIYVHPRCVYTLANFRKYSYKKDKNDTITTVINKVNDDCLDALRYSYTPLIGEDSTGFDWSSTITELEADDYSF